MKFFIHHKTVDLLRYSFGAYRKQIVALSLLGILNGLLEGIGINALIPLFSLVTNKGVGDDTLSQFLTQFFGWFHISMELSTLLIFICFMFFGKAVVLIMCNFITIKITSQYEMQTRKKLLSLALRSEWSHLLKQKLGHLENIITTDVKQSAILFQSISGALITITSLFIYILIALHLSFWISMYTFIIGSVLFFLLRPFVRKTREVARNTAILNKQVAHSINQYVTGMKTLKAVGAEQPLLEEGGRFFQKHRALKVRAFMLNHLGNAFIQPVSIIFICVIFAFTYNNPTFEFATLLAIIYLIQRIFLYVTQMQTTYQKFAETLPYLESIMDYEVEAQAHQEKITGIQPFQLSKKLSFEDVKFFYRSEQPILSNLSFDIHHGEMIGLIGPSGAGKTTIVDLMLRLLSPVSGKITLDDKDIQLVSFKDWRDHIGYVSQDIFLLNDTIENNIKFYNPDITHEMVVQAAKNAGIYDFIETCPEKFATSIGDRGIYLSTGQRQRIVIARILARRPSVLILDEATSALDNESETQIQNVLKQLKGKITILIVAHRLSTIQDCDRLLVLDKGSLIEQGKPQSLLENPNSYFYKVSHV